MSHVNASYADSQGSSTSVSHVEIDKPITKEIYEDPTQKKFDLDDDEAGKTSSLFNPDLNLEEEVRGLNELGDSFKRERSFWGKMKALEFEVDFENKKNMVLMLGTFAAFAGILSGIDQSIISGASIGMNKMLHLSTHEASLVSSLMPLGAVAGSILLTPFSEYFGRKKSLAISCVFYTVGAIVCAAASNHHEMYAGRFLIGIGAVSYTHLDVYKRQAMNHSKYPF